MRMINFAKRNFKELIRDPLSLVFEIVLPLFLLFIFKLYSINNSIWLFIYYIVYCNISCKG